MFGSQITVLTVLFIAVLGSDLTSRSLITQVKKDVESQSLNDHIKKLYESPTFMEQIKKMSESPGFMELIKKMSESPGFMEQIKKMTESPGFMEQIKKMTEYPNFIDQIKKITESSSFIDQMNKMSESPNFMNQLAKMTESLSLNQIKNMSAAINSDVTLSDIVITEVVVLEQIIKNFGSRSDDINLDIEQLVRKYGFPFEMHDLITPDGYIVRLDRIPGKGPPVLLMHGILLSSDDFVTAGPESALAYVLAREGYDVWIGNARGNKHSKRHVTLSPNQAEFWNFSWDEIGRYDLPTNIDYILNETGRDKLHYVGFSQGTTAFFVLCSQLPEYNDKIVSMVGMAPVAAMANLQSPLVQLLFYANAFQFLYSIGIYDIFPGTAFSRTICMDNEVSKFICSNAEFFLFGYDQGEVNVTNLPVIFSHAPAGSSYKQFDHYRQTFLTKRFLKYDYGRSRNLELYGSEVPPDYAVERITVPIDLFYSSSDFIATAKDTLILGSRLRNVKLRFLENFNHLDFLFGNHIKEKIYVKILEIFKRSSNDTAYGV